jgi:hypothetical protein
LAIYQHQKDTGVLVRYYRESTPSVLDRNGQWINECYSLVGRQKLAAACSMIFGANSKIEISSQSEKDASDQSLPSPNFYFTPEFGYFVLIFQVRSDSSDIVWTDMIPLPSQVPISRASVLNLGDKQSSGENREGNRFVDIFGEYVSNSEKPFATMMLAGPQEGQSEPPLKALRLVEQIPLGRSRRLIETAQAALTDTNLLGQRMMRFKKEYPEDLGSDALVISLWCHQRKTNRQLMSFEESGRVLVDATQRLFMKTSDPLLLEIQSRIYNSYGRGQEALKAVSEAETLALKSFYLLETRIHECIESKDQQRLLDYLSQLDDYYRNQPDWVFDPEVLNQWRKRFAELE